MIRGAWLTTDHHHSATAGIALVSYTPVPWLSRCVNSKGAFSCCRASRVIMRISLCSGCSPADSSVSCQPGYGMTFPGLKVFFGSRVCLIERISPSSAAALPVCRYDTFSCPIPCSAEILPAASER